MRITRLAPATALAAILTVAAAGCADDGLEVDKGPEVIETEEG